VQAMLGGPNGAHRPCHPTRKTTPTDRRRGVTPAGRALDRDLRCAGVRCLPVGFAALPRDGELNDREPD
jgi:hypothetical protein